MKTYVFFYHDSYESEVNVEMFKSYSISSPRFDSAFKSFVRFLTVSKFDYIDFCYSYNVFNGFKTQVRYLSYDQILFLKSIVKTIDSDSKETINEK